VAKAKAKGKRNAIEPLVGRGRPTRPLSLAGTESRPLFERL
jgi:hypothetical protein